MCNSINTCRLKWNKHSITVAPVYLVLCAFSWVNKCVGIPLFVKAIGVECGNIFMQNYRKSTVEQTNLWESVQILLGENLAKHGKL